ncbi:FtsJ-like methyltransferase-domain-containing protein [Fimicolochytrium jonesii]|uniref:FtsJ-like methyltransferase-domain-containing protein n=1 Tax=Fimicolochytrium jonesii TaxID=1396493 RepID=UPI0022FEA369|nr:FtsJ-like methyltransferase-domain-containing protein [Fimicolochytrium jonesii]KAI8821473.1 FtsJ-like methyltransferase-domain-containing protein [Fimicolochytrium jonesii]
MKEIVNQLYETKVKVHDLTPQALHYARSRANPYELVGRSIFVNRSAVKMANLDALCQFLDRARERCANGEFRFVDLCSGPGGFTEYILWRTKQMGLQAKGWGMTLKGEQDFALEKMDPAIDVPNRFQPFYGADQTGDVYRTANIKAFVDLVEAGSQTEGVDLVTCDGGFNVTGDEWNQEDHSRQILLCQVLIGLSVLREHGDFLFKVFDLYTPFMVELVYILYRMFEKIAIVKPFTSRPANSERYIVCRSLRAKPNAQVLQHLFGVNDKFNELKGDDAAKPIISSHATQQPGFLPREEKIKNGLTEVVHIVDPEIVMKEKGLIGPIKSQNMRLTMWQKEALEELYKYANDKARPEYDQEGIRRRCLQEWKLPIPQASRRPPPDTPYGRDRNNDGRYQSSAHNNRFSPYSRNGGNDRGRNGDGDRNRDRDRRQDDPYRHGHRDHGQAQAHRRY